jgi:4-hydroxybenzoate polyprenyltransferase
MILRLQQFPHYARLMRFDKPIGILLLLWPTWWALWLASCGCPDLVILTIFTLGVITMRSAGCILNDMADRHVDKHVLRTRARPITSGRVSINEAILLLAILCALAFSLVLFCNALTIALAFVGLFLAGLYPLLKRVTHLPQLGLGVAYSWGIPMAFAAVTGTVAPLAWFVFSVAVIWPVIFDTFYAMVDRADDLRVGIKSTAILFGRNDRMIIAILQIIFLLLMIVIGIKFQLRPIYYIALCAAAALFGYQQWLIRTRERDACFRAFLNNNKIGLVIFAGIAVSYLS